MDKCYYETLETDRNDTQEDMTIYDEPASWGNQSNYRLLSPSNNFFKIKAGSLPAKIN